MVNVASVQKALDAFWETTKSEARTLEWIVIPFPKMMELFQEIQAVSLFTDNKHHTRTLTKEERRDLAAVHSKVGIFSSNFQKSGFDPKKFFMHEFGRVVSR